jgi:Toprim-like/Protein of unknown function (DUF3991)
MTPIQKRAEQMRSIPLESVLRLAGAQPDPHDRHKWHTSQGVLSVTGSKFINWTRGLGGGGAIDLAIHLNHYGFMAALQWLEQHFTGTARPPGSQSLPRCQLQLPVPDPKNLWCVQGYLANERRLPPALTDPLIGSGLIYADAKANAVFLLLEKESHPVGAELRGTTHHPWRGMAPGSQKDLGYFSIGPNHSPSVILCESAIDAISCSTLHPPNRCVSTAGARPNPQWLAKFIEQGLEIYCGYDADAVGDAMAQAMQTRYPLVKRLRPCKKDWNDVLKSS